MLTSLEAAKLHAMIKQLDDIYADLRNMYKTSEAGWHKEPAVNFEEAMFHIDQVQGYIAALLPEENDAEVDTKQT